MNCNLVSPRMRRFVICLVALAAALVAATAVTAAAGGKEPVQLGPPKPPKADGNGNKVFDDLEATLPAARFSNGFAAPARRLAARAPSACP